jgi:21S rRNA (GM2251-2'-O)-methyltransferase
MHRRSFMTSFCRYVHQKTRLPELDFTKPTSDRSKKVSRKYQLTSEQSNHPALTKFTLLGQCLFGLHPVQLALKMKRRQFYRLFLSPTSDSQRPLMKTIQSLAEQMSVPVQLTTSNILDGLSFDRPHQGVCLDCSPLFIEDIQQIELQDTDSDGFSFDLCLVKMHDPMNLGAVLRTAHFFGINRVLLAQSTCQPSPVASKASSGAQEIMSIFSCRNLLAYLQTLREQNNIALICATHQGTIPLRTLRFDRIQSQCRLTKLKGILLLVGNEHDGIPDEIINMCHYNVCIEPSSNNEISS